MSSKLAPLFQRGCLPADSGDCPRDRLVVARIVSHPLYRFAEVKPTWVTEGQYRAMLRNGVRMVVLEER